MWASSQVGCWAMARVVRWRLHEPVDPDAGARSVGLAPGCHRLAVGADGKVRGSGVAGAYASLGDVREALGAYEAALALSASRHLRPVLRAISNLLRHLVR